MVVDVSTLDTSERMRGRILNRSNAFSLSRRLYCQLRMYIFSIISLVMANIHTWSYPQPLHCSNLANVWAKTNIGRNDATCLEISLVALRKQHPVDLQLWELILNLVIPCSLGKIGHSLQEGIIITLSDRGKRLIKTQPLARLILLTHKFLLYFETLSNHWRWDSACPYQCGEIRASLGWTRATSVHC
jgi:hypothetical protein